MCSRDSCTLTKLRPRTLPDRSGRAGPTHQYQAGHRALSASRGELQAVSAECPGQRTTWMHVCAVCCPKHAGPGRGLTKCGRKSIQRTLTKQPCRQRTNIYVRITSSRQEPQQRTQSAAMVGFSVPGAPHAVRLIAQVLSTLAENEIASLDKGVLK